MVVEETRAGKRVGEQGAAAIGELDHRIPCAGHSTPRPPRTIGRFAAASRSTASATTIGIGMHAPDFGLVHREVS